MYASKVDYLIDINETNGIFSGHYEIQTILFLATIIFLIMLTISYFGNNMELNSYFQRILLAVNKITHDTNHNYHLFCTNVYTDMYTDLELY